MIEVYQETSCVANGEDGQAELRRKWKAHHQSVKQISNYGQKNRQYD
jgi:hypothetical protein